MNNVSIENFEKIVEILNKALNKEKLEQEDVKVIEKQQVGKIQTFKGKKITFDPDSSPEAWNYFFLNYDLVKGRQINELIRKKDRLLLEVKIKNNNYYIAGDCSFNFNDNKIQKFKKLTNDNAIKNKLDICKLMHHNILNFDLIPVAGGLNNLKSKLKYESNNVIKVHDLGRAPNCLYDRLDTFMCFLDQSLSELKELNNKDIKEIGKYFSNSIFSYSLRGENFEELYNLLKNYKNICDYSQTFYSIEKKDTETLIDFGKKQLKSDNNKSESISKEELSLAEYIDLALEYWIIKGNKTIERLNEDNKYITEK